MCVSMPQLPAPPAVTWARASATAKGIAFSTIPGAIQIRTVTTVTSVLQIHVSTTTASLKTWPKIPHVHKINIVSMDVVESVPEDQAVNRPTLAAPISA